MSTTLAPATAPATTVQHITKASSDELLSKFAELDSPDDHRSNKSLRLFKRQKRSAQSLPPLARRESCEFTGGTTLLAERKSLLPPVVSARRSSGAAFVRQLKIGRSGFRSRNFRKRSFFGTIEKTWQRTLDGASKVFMETQYNRHKRLLRGFSFSEDVEEKSQRLETDLSKDILSNDRIVLGLSDSGPLTLEQVKKAYRDCALKWHPDLHDISSKAEYDHVEFCPYLSHESSRPRNRGNGWSEEFSGARDDSKRARSRARKQGFPFYEDEEEDGPKFWGSQWNSSAHYKYKRASWFDEEEEYDDSQSSSWSKSHTSSESQRLEIDLSKDRIALGLSGSGPLTLEHVKKAYRDCALKWHPDRHDGPSKVIAEEKFKACNSAYQSLCDNLGAN
ncbi:hypothetical protein SSX86_013319 [Deinandra increscens subsp. villosa]|uniref:J domain-containing protein n=1 Tax=Deinandra increscens subsp. villosa TaxID=3103831 RepID=A0AAP0DDH6_9ASTR